MQEGETTTTTIDSVTLSVSPELCDSKEELTLIAGIMALDATMKSTGVTFDGIEYGLLLFQFIEWAEIQWTLHKTRVTVRTAECERKRDLFNRCSGVIGDERARQLLPYKRDSDDNIM